MAFCSRLNTNVNAHEPSTLGVSKVLKKRTLLSKIVCRLLLNLVFGISGIRSSLSVPEVILVASRGGYST